MVRQSYDVFLKNRSIFLFFSVKWIIFAGWDNRLIHHPQININKQKTMKLLFTIMLAILTMNASAQVETPKDTPQLEFALQLKVTLGEAFAINNTQHGRRTVIPITGGTFEGPGKPSFYFRCAPQFEAPADSKYGWLNNSLFLCAPTFSSGFNGIVLNVWRVK